MISTHCQDLLQLHFTVLHTMMCFNEEKLEDIGIKWEQSQENFWIGLSLKVGCQTSTSTMQTCF